MPKIAILILAAGASKRMGKPKQLLPWKNSTLLGNAIESAKEVTNNVLVVLGANHEKIVPIIPQGTKNIINVAWQAGMGTSIALGVGELEKTVNPDAILICLVDQPLIDSDYLKRMVASAENAPYRIVATKFGVRAGVPAFFPKTYFNQLKQFGADYGAKHLMAELSNHVIELDANGKEVDLDTPANYDAYWKKHGL